MFTYVYHNIIRALLFIFPQALIHSWFAFKLFSFFKIAFLKSIRSPTLIFKDSSMCNDIALEAFFCLVLAKYDAKLPKQQIFNDFRQQLNIGASLWNLKCSIHFEFPTGTWNIFMYLYLVYCDGSGKNLYINQAHMW